VTSANGMAMVTIRKNSFCRASINSKVRPREKKIFVTSPNRA